ncbi:Uncharacterised protein [Escherichia coli]|nr:Uncharacterised protein [Escherichia coli]
MSEFLRQFFGFLYLKVFATGMTMAGYFIHATIMNDDELNPRGLIMTLKLNPNMSL